MSDTPSVSKITALGIVTAVTLVAVGAAAYFLTGGGTETAAMPMPAPSATSSPPAADEPVDPNDEGPGRAAVILDTAPCYREAGGTGEPTHTFLTGDKLRVLSERMGDWVEVHSLTPGGPKATSHSFLRKWQIDRVEGDADRGEDHRQRQQALATGASAIGARKPPGHRQAGQRIENLDVIAGVDQRQTGSDAVRDQKVIAHPFVDQKDFIERQVAKPEAEQEPDRSPGPPVNRESGQAVAKS